MNREKVWLLGRLAVLVVIVLAVLAVVGGGDLGPGAKVFAAIMVVGVVVVGFLVSRALSDRNRDRG